MLRLVRRFHLTQNPRADILSGLTVALALVPEAIAFAFVARVDPLVGLYAAFFVGLITSVFGGRSGMISGATGAMAVAMVGLVIAYGAEYLFAAILLTGLIQILAGLFHMGKFIRLVPHPVMLGFVNGLAIVIFLAQLGQFKAASHGNDTAHGEETSHSAIDVLFNGNWMQGMEMKLMLGLTLLTMAIIWVFPKIPKIGKILPASLVSILAVSALVIGLDLDTRTVGDLASVSGGLPEFHIPVVPFTWETLMIILPVSLTLAAIGLIESLLIRIINKIPKEDAFVIFLVTGVTVAYDLAIAVIIGVIVSALVYAWKSASKFWVTVWHNQEDGNKVYKLHGPLFFGSIQNFRDEVDPKKDTEGIRNADSRRTFPNIPPNIPPC